MATRTMEKRGGRTRSRESHVLPAALLGVAGLMRILDSIWAFRFHGTLNANLGNAIYGTSLRSYGWLWLIVGIFAIIASFGVLLHLPFSRYVGMLAGAVLALSAVGWLPYFPIWSLVYIGLGVFSIYALSQLGRREQVSAGGQDYGGGGGRGQDYGGGRNQEYASGGGGRDQHYASGGRDQEYASGGRDQEYASGGREGRGNPGSVNT